MGGLIWGVKIRDWGNNFIMGRIEFYGNSITYTRDVVW